MPAQKPKRPAKRRPRRLAAGTPASPPSIRTFLESPALDADRAASLAILIAGLSRALAEADMEMADFARRAIASCIAPDDDDEHIDMPLPLNIRTPRARRGKVA